MAVAYAIGKYATDSLTGKTPRLMSRGVAACAAATGYCFYVVSGTDYQVPAGKTFYITGIMNNGVNQVDQGTQSIRYADNAALTTNPVTVLTPLDTPAGTEPVCGQTLPTGAIAIPATKYLGLWNVNNGFGTHLVIFGYEA